MYEHRPKAFRDTPSHHNPKAVPSREEELEQRRRRIAEARARHHDETRGALGVRHKV